MFTWLPVLFITHVIKLSVISELVWSLSCYSLNFSPSNDQTTEHGELNDLPEASGYQRVFLILPRILSYPALVENVLFSVAPSASVLLGCPTKCCKLQTRAHTCTPPPSRVFTVTCWACHSLSQLQRPWFRIGKAKTREDWMVRLFPFPQIRPSRVFSLLEGKYTYYSEPVRKY